MSDTILGTFGLNFEEPKSSRKAKLVTTEDKDAGKKGKRSITESRKYGLIFFGDIVSASTLIRYLEGKVLFNENSIKNPSSQVSVIIFNTKDKEGDSKVTKLLDTLMDKFGHISDVIEIDTEFKNQSDAYFNAFLNNEIVLKVLEELRNKKIDYLITSYHNSVYAIYNDVGLNRMAIRSTVDYYNTANGTEIKFIPENEGRSLESEIKEISGKILPLIGKDGADKFLDGFEKNLTVITAQPDYGEFIKNNLFNIPIQLVRGKDKENKEILFKVNQYKL